VTYAYDQPTPSTLETPHVSRKSRFMRALARSGAGPSRAIAGRRWFPLWAVIHHVGRTSGKQYAFPIVSLRTEGGFLIPIPFGDATQWVRNVLAAGSSTLTWRGRDHLVVNPRVIDWSEARPRVNPVLRAIVPIVGIRSFLRVDDSPA
jgi:deazaflavin-dependent oxidoreductase (nitroreductase family)